MDRPLPDDGAAPDRRLPSCHPDRTSRSHHETGLSGRHHREDPAGILVAIREADRRPMRALEQPAPRPAPESRWTRRTIGGSTADRLIRGLVTGVIAVGAGVAVAVSPVNLAVIAAVIAAIWLIAIGRQSIAVFH